MKAIGTIFFVALMMLMTAAAVWAFDQGQSRVDAWEKQTGRYGEGLR